jgi:eukaryotic-like serine/threonine-protein kinase
MPDLNALESLYFAALEKPSAERVAFLDEACRDDQDLRARVERLLAAQPNVGDFLDALVAPIDSAASEGTVTFRSDAGATSDFPGRDEKVGSVLVGKYKLIEEIGEGGMGSVFMAQQTEPVKRAVAVKVIKAGMDSKSVLARFEAERQALAMMDHPNIARVLDAGTTESGRPFFVMELVKGIPITRFCDERKLTPRQRLELFVPVCQAIQHAHQKGPGERQVTAAT